MTLGIPWLVDALLHSPPLSTHGLLPVCPNPCVSMTPVMESRPIQIQCDLVLITTAKILCLTKVTFTSSGKEDFHLLVDRSTVQPVMIMALKRNRKYGKDKNWKAGARAGYLICRTWCKMKIWNLMFKIRKNIFLSSMVSLVSSRRSFH